MMNTQTYRGVLIDESVRKPDVILANAKTISQRQTKLEGEDFRGTVNFHNIEVSSEKLWTVLELVAKSIRHPGWYFHLVKDDCLYVVMPNVILMAKNKPQEINQIVQYAKSKGIHEEQLNLSQLFKNPFA